MTYSYAKVQGQWSVSYEDRLETNGRTEATSLPARVANAVGSDTLFLLLSIQLITDEFAVDSRKFARNFIGL